MPPVAHLRIQDCPRDIFIEPLTRFDFYDSRRARPPLFAPHATDFHFRRATPVRPNRSQPWIFRYSADSVPRTLSWPPPRRRPGLAPAPPRPPRAARGTTPKPRWPPPWRCRSTACPTSTSACSSRCSTAERGLGVRVHVYVGLACLDVDFLGCFFRLGLMWGRKRSCRVWR